MSHYKTLLLSIKYMIDTHNYCYHMKPGGKLNVPRELRGYGDTDYAVDNDTRKSVTGYIVLINRVFIVWRFQS